MPKKETQIEETQIEKIEPLFLTIEEKVLGINLRFPLQVTSERDYLDAIRLIEGKDLDAITTISDALPFYDYILELVMKDCVNYYKDKNDASGKFIQKFIKEKYDVFDKEKSLNHFRQICRFTIEELNELNQYYGSYSTALTKEYAEIDKNYQSELKLIDVAPNVSADDKRLKRIELENETKEKKKEVEKTLKLKYGVEE